MDLIVYRLATACHDYVALYAYDLSNLASPLYDCSFVNLSVSLLYNFLVVDVPIYLAVFFHGEGVLCLLTPS